MKLEARLLKAINRQAGLVVLRSDVASLGSTSQVSSALRVLVDRGILVRIGVGLYAKTRVNSFTGETVPAGSLETVATQALQRLGIRVSVGAAAAEYNAAGTSQLPRDFVVNTGKRRIRRKIIVGGRGLRHENDYKNSALGNTGPSEDGTSQAARTKGVRRNESTFALAQHFATSPKYSAKGALAALRAALEVKSDDPYPIPRPK